MRTEPCDQFTHCEDEFISRAWVAYTYWGKPEYQLETVFQFSKKTPVFCTKSPEWIYIAKFGAPGR